MKKKKGLKWYYWVLIALAVVILGMIAFGKKDNSIKVSVEKVEKQSITETVSANGKLQPEVEVKISPEVSGKIIDVYVAEGDSVKKGQLLMRINPDLLETEQARNIANLNSSRANLENARSRLAQLESRFKAEIEPAYKRNQQLYQQKVISLAEWQTSQSTYQSAQDEINAAKASVEAAKFSVKASEEIVNRSGRDLTRTEIYATMDGIISKLNVKKGETVLGTVQMSGTELLRIADLSSMEMQVDVSENDIIRVSLGDTAIVEVDAYPGKKFKGIVKEIANSATTSVAATTDQVTNFVVKIRVLRESYSDIMQGIAKNLSPFRPGMSGTADIQTDRQNNVLSVPIEAVTTRSKDGDKRNKEGGDDKDAKKDEAPNKKGKDDEDKEEKSEVVFKYENGKVTMVKVKTGIQDNKYIQILEGLKDGEEVVTGPYSAVSKSLKDGDAVIKTDKKDLFNRKKEK